MARKLLLTTFVLGAGCVLASPASATEYPYDGQRDDDFHSDRAREGLVMQVGMLYGAVRVDDAKLHTLQSVPAPLDGKDLRIDGGTTMMGGLIGAHFFTKGFRIGLIESFAGTQGMQLTHAPLDRGYTLEANAWRLGVEVNVGHQFAVGKLSPYADLRIGYSMLAATVKLRDPELGVLGSTNYTAWAPIIGPRVGVLVPISKVALVDVALTYGLLGHDGAGLTIGLGYGIGRFGL